MGLPYTVAVRTDGDVVKGKVLHEPGIKPGTPNLTSKLSAKPSLHVENIKKI